MRRASEEMVVERPRAISFNDWWIEEATCSPTSSVLARGNRGGGGRECPGGSATHNMFPVHGGFFHVDDGVMVEGAKTASPPTSRAKCRSLGSAPKNFSKNKVRTLGAWLVTCNALKNTTRSKVSLLFLIDARYPDLGRRVA